MRQLDTSSTNVQGHSVLGFVLCSNTKRKLLKYSPIFIFTSNKLCHHTNCYNIERLAGNNCGSTAYYVPSGVLYTYSTDENMKQALAYRKTCLQQTSRKTV
jgi:hypothetical protein